MQDTGTICQPDLVPQELHSLPGAQIKDVVKNLQRLVLLSGCYLLLLIYVVIGDTARVNYLYLDLPQSSGGKGERHGVALLAPAGERERPRDGRQMLTVTAGLQVL